MEGVEHLGQYVFEMTKAKVEALKAGGGQLPPANGDVKMANTPDEEEDADREENVLVEEGLVDGDDYGPEDEEAP